MRILFDSKQPQYKNPFGTLLPGQMCSLCVHVPLSVEARYVTCRIREEDGAPCMEVPLQLREVQGPYACFAGEFQLSRPGLYFYYFYVHNPAGGFRLFKYGDDTNMEAGDLWQVSCVPEAFHAPDWAKGAVIYQVFPDRFCKKGDCDVSDKLTPYCVHENWDEEVTWQPNPEGVVLNNDFFGGNFAGITEKMEHIAALGVNILYLNPISKSFSSHRYDTGDYKIPDPMLGTMEDFITLCHTAHKYNIRVILDGVFSHTGSNSLYFNREGQFPSVGAYQSQSSPYYSWYQFHQWPDRYNSWWGFDTLPTVNKLDPGFVEYIITGGDSVVAHWLNAGCDGFRLDVADELPSEFLLLLKKRLRQIKPDALLMGEVWEDASNKIAYDRRCRYFVDGVLDSVMNYPFRNAIMRYVRGEDSGWGLKNAIMQIAENYPRDVLLSNMNLLGTHDTPRVLTALVDDFNGPRESLAERFLTPEQRILAVQRLKLATFLQYTLPGSPSIYYGDEAGMEGDKDPFNRRTYPWGKEDPELMTHYWNLGTLRQQEVLRLGDVSFFQAGEGKVGFTRRHADKQLKIYVNQSGEEWPILQGKLVYGEKVQRRGAVWKLSNMGYCVMEEE